MTDLSPAMRTWFWRHVPHAHSWRVEEYNKRFCRRCGREEWVFSNPHPRIGEPARQWKEMRFDRLKF